MNAASPFARIKTVDDALFFVCETLTELGIVPIRQDHVRCYLFPPGPAVKGEGKRWAKNLVLGETEREHILRYTRNLGSPHFRVVLQSEAAFNAFREGISKVMQEVRRPKNLDVWLTKRLAKLVAEGKLERIPDREDSRQGSYRIAPYASTTTLFRSATEIRSVVKGGWAVFRGDDTIFEPRWAPALWGRDFDMLPIERDVKELILRQITELVGVFGVMYGCNPPAPESLDAEAPREKRGIDLRRKRAAVEVRGDHEVDMDRFLVVAASRGRPVFGRSGMVRALLPLKQWNQPRYVEMLEGIRDDLVKNPNPLERILRSVAG